MTNKKYKEIIVNGIYRVILYIILGLFTFLAIYPILWLLLQSFKTNQVYLTTNKLSLPAVWYFGNYPRIWNNAGLSDGFSNFFKNSLIYTTITVTAVVLFANMAGYAFAKIQYRITKLLHGLFIVGILLTIQSILIPLFLMINSAGIFNTRLGILIPYIGLGLPMGVYLCTDFIKKGIPNELLESSRIDGAGFLTTFARIVFPMCAPVSVTLAIITFTGTWNEFILMNLLTAGDRYKAIPAAVGRFAGSLGADYGRLFTTLSLSIIPILAFYLAFRNQITKGVAAGAVKG
ncbi:MAG: carbohydrate ABC transporter permease [Oscillospiraceae bacterium]|nr:carbohydrate ABC transporter permease [Oscillospiraceae bacterium]